MLSLGKWHEQVPKDKNANLKYRLDLLRVCDTSEKQRAIVEACRQDILFFINCFVWQFNPKKKGLDAIGPFITWPFQERALLARPETDGKKGFLWCYENNRSAVIEKSREMGATWLFLILQDWLCLFHPYVQSLNISRSADAVDCQSPDSLFWKIRFLHRHLPDWMRGIITEQKMYFGYERTNSVVTGEASTGRAGVGGRAGVIFIDEFSKIKEATEVRQRTANTADCRFFNSTHEGMGTEFYKLTVTPEFVKIQMHWTEHPEKWPGAYRYDQLTGKVKVLDKGYQYPPDFNFVMSEAPLGGPCPGIRSPWYDHKCVEIGSPRGVAIELDIDVGGSVAQVFNPLLIRTLRLQFACPPFWEGDIHYDRDRGRPIKLIPMEGGPLKLWVMPIANGNMPIASYGAGADLATGVGATNSCLSVINAQTGEKVLDYATPHMYPEKFAVVVSAILWLFQDQHGQPAKFAWEHQGPGRTFAKSFLELGYPRIYIREGGVGNFAVTTSDLPGWYPNRETKRLLLDEYRAGLESRQCLVRCDDSLRECGPWRYGSQGEPEHPGEVQKDDPTGARENHGDRVIADALAWKMAKTLCQPEKAKRQLDDLPILSLAWRKKLVHDREREEESA